MAQDDAPVSPVGVSKPELTLSAAAINEGAPVELDSKPASPESIQTRRRGSQDALSPEEQARRMQLRKEREGDPAVVMDVSQTPNAEEFEKSGASQQDEDKAAAAGQDSVDTSSS